jgi:hypothetical protein
VRDHYRERSEDFGGPINLKCYTRFQYSGLMPP